MQKGKEKWWLKQSQSVQWREWFPFLQVYSVVTPTANCSTSCFAETDSLQFSDRKWLLRKKLNLTPALLPHSYLQKDLHSLERVFCFIEPWQCSSCFSFRKRLKHLAFQVISGRLSETKASFRLFVQLRLETRSPAATACSCPIAISWLDLEFFSVWGKYRGLFRTVQLGSFKLVCDLSMLDQKSAWALPFGPTEEYLFSFVLRICYPATQITLVVRH